jgi:UV DNA damage endonuclease
VINHGLCCISLGLSDSGIKFQTLTFTRFKALQRQEALSTLSKRILNNFKVTLKTIEYCISNNIHCYRISSDILPVISHPEINIDLTDLQDADQIFITIDNIKKTIKDSGIRISAHPPEFISFTSQNDQVIKNSIRDLEEHAMLLDLFGCPQDYRSPLNIHIRQDGDPEELSKKFMSAYNTLIPSVKNRIVLEVNDNRNGTWSIKNLVNYFHKRHGIPITFDSLHHSFLHGNQSEEEAFNEAYQTWPTRPLFHYSEGVDGTRKHADMPTAAPKSFNKPVDFDIELKSKDYAIFKIKQIENERQAAFCS